MNHYTYQCSDCHKVFAADEIENQFHYLCPECGRADKQHPLQGVLLVQYDWSEIRSHVSREQFLKLPVGQFWKYPYLWPLDSRKMNLRDIPEPLLHSLALPTNLFWTIPVEDANPLWIMDDTRNPTYSFKDRASSLVVLKAVQMNLSRISAASTGNAASSLAGICARINAGLPDRPIKADIWVPESIPPAKLMQIQAYGADVHLVKGDYDAAFDLCLEVARHKGWYNRNTGYNPLTIEGKKSAAYDIFLGFTGDIPDTIFIPVGDGVILSGIFKGFQELQQLGWIEKLPRLVAVQAEGSNALVRYLQTGEFQYRQAKTIADSISAGAPRCLFLAAQAIKKSDGMALAVSDAEILSAQKYLAQQAGLLVEPSAAAALAGFLKYKMHYTVNPNEKILILLTGSGLKDHQAFQQWIKPPESRTPEVWREVMGL